ncbi:MAG: tyrosine--tRNA ligase [Sandaracinaceae bacterium]|nr:tyrosine--tRNA ligase [Sandaracinaceae bacterium]
MTQFFERTDGPAPIFVNNADWYRQLDVIEFLRDVGKHFSVNQMLTRDSVRSRIEREGQGISFTEFSYQLLQSYDFLHLFRTYGCRWQMGASDQWGNIVSGIDLVRRCTGEKVLVLTLPLLTNYKGKIRKAQGGHGLARPRADHALRLLSVLAKHRRRRHAAFSRMADRSLPRGDR